MRVDPAEPFVIQLRRRGLAAPARLLLEAHRPLRPLLDDVATFLAPLGGPILGSRMNDVEHVLGDPDAYDRLTDRLAEPDDGRSSRDA